MNRSFFGAILIAGLVLVGADGLRAKEQSESPIVIGTRVSFESRILNETRQLEVYLPGDYDRSAEKYPVLYVLDGDWLFQYCVSIVHMLTPNYFPRMIVIGIPNTDRRRDLDPAAAGRPGEESGSERFLRFIREELIPFVEGKYRAHSFRILTGHSLAGLYALFNGLKSPSTFAAYIATSPSIASEERFRLLSGIVDSRPAASWEQRFLYISGGGNEGADLQKAIAAFGLRLKDGVCPGLEWSTDIFEGEGHVPVRGFYQGLQRLFADWMISRELLAKADLTGIQGHYRALSEKFGWEVRVPPDVLASIGRRAITEGKNIEAVKIFEHYVEQYPRDAEAFVFLGNAWLNTGNPRAAEKCYRQALQLDPGQKAALAALERLKK